MNTRRRPVLVSLVVAALMTAVLGACGDDEDEAAESTVPTTAPAPRGAPAVDVAMSEYAFSVSGPLMAGGTLRFSNTGKEFHMAGMGKLKPGRTLDDFRKALEESGPPGGGEGGEGGGGGGEGGGGGSGATTTTGGRGTTARVTTTSAGGQAGQGGQGGQGQEGGEEERDPTADIVDQLGAPGGIMGPGQSAEVTVPTLGAGNYVFVCFIPTEGPEGVPHFVRGMINQIEVVDTKAPEPTAHATYRVSNGRAVEGPATLSAGRHVLKIEAGEGGAALEPTLVLPDPGKTFKDMNAVFEQFEETVPVGAADKVPGTLVFELFDLEQANTVYVATDFKAGTYQLVAEDTDEEPQDFRESITIKVA